METKLQPKGFSRIHRSAIVNAERIAEMRPLDNGEYRVLLRDGTELRLSRSYRQQLASLLGGCSGAGCRASPAQQAAEQVGFG